MRNNLIHRAGIKAIVFAIALIVSSIGGFISYGQRNNKSTVSQSVDDPYSMSPDSRFKPEMRYFLVRLKGDNGISIIDLNGNVISRNVLPVTNSQGKIFGSNYSNPVINDLFCIERAKEPGKGGSLYIYRNALRPTPIEGLTDLYSANIINPNLFAISRYGERIKFVDSNGNEKFTVMPIDGKEPREVIPVATNGVIIVTVCSVVKKKDHVDYIEKKRCHRYKREMGGLSGMGQTRIPV